MYRQVRFLVDSLLLALMAATMGVTPAVARDLRVRYLSTDFVYLDGGTADSLAVGDTLRLTRDSVEVGDAVVEHAAEHSAACRLLTRIRSAQIGDAARILTRAATPGTASPPASREVPEIPVTTAGAAPKPPPPVADTVRVRPKGGVSGYAAVQWYRFADRGGPKFKYDQPTLRLQFKARRLFGRSLTFEVKGRARHDHRLRSFNGTVPASEWSNRLYALSLAYDEPDAVWNWQAGRLVSNALAATGPVDGALVEARVSSVVRCGAFGGTLPDLSNTAPRGSIKKYGLFVRAEQGEYGARRWSAALAGTAEYHGATVSRQYTFLQADFQSGRRWNLHESLELDLNSGWRRRPGTASVSVTNQYASIGYRPANQASISLTYDNRRNYRTWDNRSLPDSLFDAAFRTGLRLNANLRLLRTWSAYGNVGRQHEQGHSQDTWSWSGGLTGNRILSDRVSLTVQTSGFSGRWAKGVTPSVQLRKTFLTGHWVGLAGGAYVYTPKSFGGRRTNDWARVEATGYLSARVYVTGQYERDWGTDVKGDRVTAEAGVHF
jgi:hypothetical protein